MQGASSLHERSHAIASFTTVRLAVAAMLDANAADLVIDRACATCGADHGRPRIANAEGLDVSVSHAGEWVVVAVALGCRIGVDAVRGDDRYWTAVEAVLKCDGPGIRTLHSGFQITTEPLRLNRYPSRPALVDRISLVPLCTPARITATLAVDTEPGTSGDLVEHAIATGGR